MPFPILGVDSDNGAEFINVYLFLWCRNREITFTRARPTNKNDGCHVEQKNWAVVRTLVATPDRHRRTWSRTVYVRRRDGRIHKGVSMSRHRVVIIGSGFGGLNAAKALKRADVDVTLISKTTTHLFQPLLYQVATGILSEGDIAPTTRLILRKQKNVRVLWGEVDAIDLTAKTVTSHLMGMETVTPYDSLIVAAGAQQSYFGNDEFATFAPGMKTIDDALELRGRILGAFEAAEVATDPAERRTPAHLRGGRVPDPRASSWPARSSNWPSAPWPGHFGPSRPATAG